MSTAEPASAPLQADASFFFLRRRLSRANKAKLQARQAANDENGGERARRQQRVLSLLLDLLDDSGVLRSREYSSRRDVAGYASSGGWSSSSGSQSAEEPELSDAVAHPPDPPTDLASNFSAGSSSDAPGGERRGWLKSARCAVPESAQQQWKWVSSSGREGGDEGGEDRDVDLASEGYANDDFDAVSLSTMSRASSGSGIEDEHGWVPMMGHLSPVSVTGSVEEEIVGESDREELDSPSTQEAKEDFLVSPKHSPSVPGLVPG